MHLDEQTSSFPFLQTSIPPSPGSTSALTRLRGLAAQECDFECCASKQAIELMGLVLARIAGMGCSEDLPYSLGRVSASRFVPSCFCGRLDGARTARRTSIGTSREWASRRWPGGASADALHPARTRTPTPDQPAQAPTTTPAAAENHHRRPTPPTPAVVKTFQPNPLMFNGPKTKNGPNPRSRADCSFRSSRLWVA